MVLIQATTARNITRERIMAAFSWAGFMPESYEWWRYAFAVDHVRTNYGEVIWIYGTNFRHSPCAIRIFDQIIYL